MAPPGELGYVGISGGRGRKGVRVMQERTGSQPVGSPATGTPKPGSNAGPGANEAWFDAVIPILEARAYPEETIGAPTSTGAGGPPGTGQAAGKAKRARPAAAKSPEAKAGPDAKGKGAKGKDRKGKAGGSKVNVLTFIKIGGGILACVAIPPLVGEFLHLAFHTGKTQTLWLTVALYPIFVILVGWILVRALFKPIANPDAKDLPLPTETADHGTRDDGSTLM